MSKSASKAFAEAVEAAMVEPRVTKSELARRLRTSVGQVDRILKGENVSIATAEAVAKALGMKLRVGLEAS